MEEKKKILLLCGGKFAFKAIQLLAVEKYLFGIGIGEGSEIIVDALERECENNDIPFQSFSNRKSISEMRTWINSIQPDYIFSISFPFLIPDDVLAYGAEKFINFHPGPLPQYRGVMPIFEVLKNQEKETAICAHFMNSKFDEGNIIFNDPISIDKDETYGKLAVKLSSRVAQVALNVANMLQFASKIPSSIQDETESYYYEKPQLSDTYINWKKMEASEIIALINACNPWNTGADASFLGEQIKIISASLIHEGHNNAMPGTILQLAEDNTINVACSDNQQIAIEIMSTDEGIMTAKQIMANRNLTGNIFN
ncbi:methionyl-tRNA formyltransferase [Flavobacterium sp.]|uniref:methionyl-tRNA formyltransferase n=1 Tax=Flavobacterium sp. TaxID=239 RepID=UPI0038FD05FC